jgi:hypothetical protein
MRRNETEQDGVRWNETVRDGTRQDKTGRDSKLDRQELLKTFLGGLSAHVSKNILFKGKYIYGVNAKSTDSLLNNRIQKYCQNYILSSLHNSVQQLRFHLILLHCPH